ncbi:MAG: hypothetical protein CL670_12545 [Balneola sp.]|jgi:hypothetical protein|nr:hypothetical protein [Balneola sp.]MBE79976.1 hypothetical protein [Balneola sp.]|tara:strand:+ start:1436 stop:1627 length:192 start_codon:yes stop_codon:yes gene_type:complete
MAKVTYKGMLPDDHPVYKDGGYNVITGGNLNPLWVESMKRQGKLTTKQSDDSASKDRLEEDDS